jgi:hypothetical protein
VSALPHYILQPQSKPPVDPIMALSEDQWDAWVARDSLLSFTRRMFPPYQTAPHHQVIASCLESAVNGEFDRIIIVLPPRFGKSTLISEHFPAWLLGKRPGDRVIACSHTAHLAYFFSRRVRGILNHPQWPFPGVTVANDEGSVSTWGINGHRGGYVAAGVGGSVTGFGANFLLIDDAVKSAAEAQSDTFRENTWEWFTGTALTRLEPGGVVVVVGTRWHEDDLIGRILRSPDAARWAMLQMPALADDENVFAELTLPESQARHLGVVQGEVLLPEDDRLRTQGR